MKHWTEERIRELVPEAKIYSSPADGYLVIDIPGVIHQLREDSPLLAFICQTREELDTAHTAIQNIGTQLEESRAELAIARKAVDGAILMNNERLDDIDRLRAALELVLDCSINPAHTMTKSGLEDCIDACNKIARQALTPKGAHQ